MPPDIPHEVRFVLVGMRRKDGAVRPFREPKILSHMRGNPRDEYLYIRRDGLPVGRADVEAVCRCAECRAGLLHRDAELRALAVRSPIANPGRRPN